MATFDDQIQAGYRTFCMKPSQHTDDLAEVRAICDQMVSYLATLDHLLKRG